MIDLKFFSPALAASPGPQTFAEPQALPAPEADFAAVFDAQAALLSDPPMAEAEAIELPLPEVEGLVEPDVTSIEMTSPERALFAMPASVVSLTSTEPDFKTPEPKSLRPDSEEASSQKESFVAKLSGDPFSDIVLLTEQLVRTLGRGEMAFEGVRDSFQSLRADHSDFEWTVPAEAVPVIFEESSPFDCIADVARPMPAVAPVAVPTLEDTLPPPAPKGTAPETEAIVQSVPEVVIEPAQVIAAPMPVPIALSGKTGRSSPRTLDEMPSAEPTKLPAIEEIREPESDSLLDETVLLIPVMPPAVPMEIMPAAPESNAENLISAPQAASADSVPASMPAVESFTAPAADISSDLPPVFDRDAQATDITTVDATPALKAANPMEGAKPAIQAASSEFVSVPSSPIRQAAPADLPPVEAQIPRPQAETVNPPLPQRPMEKPVQEAAPGPQSPLAQAGPVDFVSPDQVAPQPAYSPEESEFVPVENKLPEAPQGFSAPVVVEPVIIEDAAPQHRNAVPVEPGRRPVPINPSAAESEPLISPPRPEKTADAPIEMKEPAPRQSRIDTAPVEKTDIAISADEEIAPVEKLDISLSSDEVTLPRTDAPAIERASVPGEPQMPRGPEPLEPRAEELFEAQVRGGDEVNEIRRESAAAIEYAAVPPVEPEALLSTPSVVDPVSQTRVEPQRAMSAAPAIVQAPKDAMPAVLAAPVGPQSVSFATEEPPELMQLAPESIESAMVTEAGSTPVPRASMLIAPARAVSAIRPGRASLRIPDALRATESAIAPVQEEVRAEAASSQEAAALPEMPVSQDGLPSGPREFTPLNIVPERNLPAENGTNPNPSPTGEDAVVAAIDAPEARARFTSEGTGRMQAERNAFRSLRMESQPRRAAGEADTGGAPVNFPAVFAEQVSLQNAPASRAELPESIARQVAEPMVEASEHLPAGNSRSLRLTLRPEEFGQVELQITRDADGRVHAVFAAERESASQALHEGIPHLRETLERAGLQIDQLIVNTGGQAMSFGQGADKQTPNREFLPPRSSDSFEAEALPPGGESTADDRLLNVHA